MSLTRNKRKRPENDPAVMAAPSRRRSRDSRATDESTSDFPINHGAESKTALGEDVDTTITTPGTTTTTTITATSKQQHQGPSSKSEKVNSKSKSGNADNHDEVPEKSKPPLSEDPGAATEQADPGHGSIDDGSVPKLPLHASTWGNAAPNSDPDTNDRKSQIRALIAHRSLLLSRIRSCRGAADKRLADTKAVAQTKGGTGGSLREMTDDDEIETHRELTKIANLAAKKARGEGEVQTEKAQRTSLSLRRGSSVGKRMNAALSSLAPGAAYSTTGHISPAHVQPPPIGDFLSGTAATGAAEQIIPGPMTVGGTAISHPSKTAKPASSHSIPRQSSMSGLDGKQNRPSAGKSSKSVTQSIPRAASVTKLEQIPSSARPVHQVPPRMPQPKSNFTQAMMLRKKRDEINSKLTALMQHRGVDKIHRKLPPAPHDNEIPPKVDLPKRRKTHWDRLLQEMSWLATDFIEERKWKMSSARAISHAISSSGITVGNINSSLKKSKNTPHAPIVDIKHSTDLTRSTPVVLDKEKETQTLSVDQMKYIMPSSEDLKMAKKASRLASSMITELVVAMNKGGAMGQTDEVHAEALDRFSKVRAKLLNLVPAVENPSTHKDEDMNKEKSSDANTTQPETTLDKTTTSIENQSGEGEVTFSDISQRLRDLGPVPRKKEKFPFKDVTTAARGRKLKFPNDQKDIVEFVDTIWSTSSAGAMLSGIPSSGKTVATCCLLWKYRNSGPQMIICPPASLLRWKYEMILFKDLRVLNFGLVGGIGCALKEPSVPNIIPGPGDVVLCEYASVGKILSLVRDKQVNFFSLCIDCRHPEGMFGSMATNNSKGKGNSGWHGPSELLSGDWWDNVIALASRNDPKRLIVDYCDSDLYSLERSGLGQRQQLEIMSLRTAFVVGPRTFRPSNYSIPRTVITWARHQGKKSGEDKFERVRRVLQETISPLSTCIRKTIHSLPFATWEIRECEMPGAQRAAYDSCCAHIRGALSSPLGDLQSHDDFGSRTFHAVAAALFRLRQLCLCSSNVERAEQGEHQLSVDGLPFLHTEPCSVDATPTEAGPFKMASDNSSQPDYELAEVLMNNSGKFTQLVSILESECGYILDDEIPTFRNEKRTADSSLRAKRKVVILANLPRTQWLVSILLGSLGIRHKLIRREFSHTPTASKNEIKKHNQAALSWAEAQLVLAAFNLEEEIRDSIGIYSGADVLIVSPDSLASWHGGVGIDKADFVISLDEDWSGREMATLEAALSRWKACMTLQKSTSKTIRLICKKSIETKLFSKKSGIAFQSPLDESGSHILYRAIDELIPVYQDAIDARTSTSRILPGINILQLRGEALNDVLMSSVDLAPSFVTGSTMLFLPLKDGHAASGNRDDTEIGRELYFLRALFELESRETSKDLSSSFTDSFTFTKKQHFGSGVLPPEPRSFPEQVMSRSDLQFLSVRYYFERQVLTSGSSSSVPSGVALGQPSSTGEVVTSNVVSVSASVDHDGSAMVDAWKKSGLGLKPDEMAKSMLCYSANRGRQAWRNDDHRHSFNTVRHNAYAQIYSSSWDRNLVRDGSQGCEAVVFCPPLFPKMQLAPYPSRDKPQIASPDDNPRKRKQTPDATVAPPNSVREPKRKQFDFPEPGDSNTKRPRTDPMADIVPSPQNGDSITGGLMPMDDDFLTKKNDVPVAETTVPRTPHVATPQERTSKPVKVPEAENLRADEDDYGFLGSGALPLPVYSALLMANETTSVGKASDGMDDFIQDIVPCDSEEAAISSVAGRNDEPLRLMALVVRKRPKISSQFPLGQVHHLQPGIGQDDQRRLPPPPGAHADLLVTSQANGEEIGKKIKKKVSSQGPPSAFTRIPTIGVGLPSTTPLPAMLDGKTGPKHRMLATYTSRRLATGLSMFESASYRTAMMHVQNRVKKRVQMALMKNHLVSDSGPGIPMFASNQPKAMTELGQGVVHFGNMVLQLKEGSTTGDAAKSLATAQRSALRRSLVSPCRVDFGPFQSGFLGSPSGMTAISPPRSRLGVSLPMGVKVAPSVHDHTTPAWTAEEDKHLQEAAVKYGMNWIVIARALSGVDGFVVAESRCRLATVQRSARQCRDRWQSLARTQPSLAGEVRKSEKILRENALKSAESLVDESDVHSASVAHSNGKSKVALLSRIALFQDDSDNDKKMDCDAPESHEAEQANAVGTPNLRPKRSFSILKSAMAKRDVIPLTLPGIPPSGQSNQPVPSHPSHMQSVQTSVSAQLSNGRTEMWPLQILDCADKHRAAARASTSQRSTEGPPTTAASTLARKPTSTSGSVVSPTNNPTVPTSTRTLPTAVPASTVGGPSRAPTGQRPSPTTNPSPHKGKATMDTSKQVTPKSSPVAKSTDNSKPPAK